jgi:hypothetical protein
MHTRKYKVEVAVGFQSHRWCELHVYLNDCPEDLDDINATLLDEVQKQYTNLVEGEMVAFVTLLHWEATDPD